MATAFHVRDALRYGVHATRTTAGALLAPAALYSALTVALGVPMDRLQPGQEAWLLPMLPAYFLLVLFLTLGLTRAALRAHDGQPITWRDAFNFSQQAGPFLGASALLTLLTMVGGVFFLVPGLLALVFGTFALWLVVDERLGAAAAVGRSFALTRGHRLRLIGLMAVLTLPTVLVTGIGGTTPWGYGLQALVMTGVMLMYWHAVTFAYRRLRERAAQ